MKICKMNDKKVTFVKAARAMLGAERTTINRAEINAVLAENDLPNCSWLKSSKMRKTRGEYWLPTVDGKYATDLVEAVNSVIDTVNESVASIQMAPSAVGVMEEQDSYVPEKFPGYVAWGNFNTVKDVIKSRIFYPMFITGLSGNGKTLMVKETCARLNREYVRANITVETDEDDLIGGFRLLNGETVWHDGPVVTAMKRGALLLLDEVDLASNKIMCLQPVLEGSSIYLKKIGKWVHPAEGFNVIATANTKGQGSDGGRFIGTNIMNESFLERFPVTVEQSYPTNKIEEKILTNELAKQDKVDEGFVGNLVKWADVIRKTFYEGGIDEIISTRRLVHIVNAFGIFDDKAKAITMCISRFDTETRDSFLDLYTKVDSGVSVEDIVNEVTQVNDDFDDDDDDEDSEY